MSAQAVRMIYKKEPFIIPELKLRNYREDYFQTELDLESDVFYELRVSNGWLPHKINESSPGELEEIRKFFNQYKDSFYFYFENNELIGSVLCKRNYIQSLSIAGKYQRKGYGSLLAKYAVNKILGKGFQCVELFVFPDNVKAIGMYKKLGFEIID